MLLFAESFDRIASNGGSSNILNGKWTSISGGIIWNGGRTGMYLRDGSGVDYGYWSCAVAERDDVMFLGTAARREQYKTNSAEAGILSNAVNVHQVGWSIRSDGALEVRRGMTALTGNTSNPGGTVIGTTGTNVFDLNTWHYIWLWAKIHSSAGEFELWVDGALESSATGINTNHDGTGVGRGFAINFHTSNGDHQWDDIVFCNEQGTENTALPGADPRVYALGSNGNGFYNGWIGSDGNQVDNYLQEDETVPDSDATYNYSQTVGDRDSYAMGNLAVSGTVLGLQIDDYARKDEAALREIQLFSRLAGTNLDGAVKTLSTSYGWHREVQEQKPGGGDWTDADVNDVEIGHLLAT